MVAATSLASDEWVSNVDITELRVERVANDTTRILHHLHLHTAQPVPATLERGRYLCLSWPVGGVWKVTSVRDEHSIHCVASKRMELSKSEVAALALDDQYEISTPQRQQYAPQVFTWKMEMRARGATGEQQWFVSELQSPEDSSTAKLSARLLTRMPLVQVALNVTSVHDIDTVRQRYAADVTWKVTLPGVTSVRDDSMVHEFLHLIDFDEHAFGFTNAIDTRQEEKIKMDFETHSGAAERSKDAVSRLSSGMSEFSLNSNEIIHIGSWRNASPWRLYSLTFKRRVVAEFTAEMALHDFPFDQQTLSFSFSMDQGLAKCTPVEPTPGLPGRFAIKNFKMNNVWKPLTNDMVFLGEVVDEDAPKTIQFELLLERRSTHYLTNIALPAMIITYLCFSSYAPQKDKEKGDKKGSNLMDTAARLQIVFALLLTAVTFKNQVAVSIPQVSYFTTLDKYVFVCFMITCAVAVETALFPLVARWWGQSDSWREYYLLWSSVWAFTFINIFWASYLFAWLGNRRRLVRWILDLAGYVRALARNAHLDDETRKALLVERMRMQQPMQWKSAVSEAESDAVEPEAGPGTDRDIENDSPRATEAFVGLTLLQKFTFVSHSGEIRVKLPREVSGIFMSITPKTDAGHDELARKQVEGLQSHRPC